MAMAASIAVASGHLPSVSAPPVCRKGTNVVGMPQAPASKPTKRAASLPLGLWPTAASSRSNKRQALQPLCL